MEQIANPISGCFVESQVADDEDENSDDDGDTDMQFLSYRETQDVRKGKSLVTSKKPRQVVGALIDIETRKPVNFRGNIHLPGQWWRVIALRTKKARDKKHYPSDMHALTYRLRDDDRRFRDNVVHILLTKIGQDLTTGKGKKGDSSSENNKSSDKTDLNETAAMDKKPVYFKGKEKFYTYLREHDQYDDLDIFNLEERVNEFYDSYVEQEEAESTHGDEEEDPFFKSQKNNQFPNQTLVTKTKEGFELARDFKSLVLGSLEFRSIKLAQTYPDLVRYLPQLFPYQFLGLVTLPDDRHKNLLEAVENTPGHLAFKQIVCKDYDVIGVETTYQALERCGLLAKVPQVERDAIMIYEYLKRKTKEEGHTGVKFDAIMDYFGNEIGLIEEAHQFLEKHKITKTRMEGGYRMVYLMKLWEAEKKIAKGISSLFTLQEAQPWKLDVDWDSEMFTSIKDDSDQWRAAQLIANQPVVAISGKGGCGKTYVVTQVITAARAASIQPTETEKDKGCDGADESDIMDDSDLMEYREPDQQKQPRRVNLLLTAPTGKAANLLGKRANRPSYTLHQVIYSHNGEHEWKHKDVNTLVVDECSLVAVSTFSSLIQLLIKHAQLRRIVLLGDVRQLPSIESGNFLDDIFQSLSRVGCGLELRNNHRAESQIIVDNATSISKRLYPRFVPEKFELLKVPESNPMETGDDTVNDDTAIEVTKVLNHPALQDDSKSQFISFTRKICERINEDCCRKYSQHPTKTPKNRWDFRVKDKICCTRNGYVQNYEDDHGVMKVKRKSATTSNNKKTDSIDDSGMNDTGVGLQEDNADPGDGLEPSSGVDKSSGTSDKNNEPLKKRLCNGEIYFIQDVKIEIDRNHEQREYFYLSERDPNEPDEGFWVERKELKHQCQIRHAWARTIHTFQGSETDHIVYIVGKRNRHQNWQHVYTAITRGRKSVFIIGQESVLRQVIKTRETKRNTSLRKQLTELLQKNADFMSSQSVLKQSLLCMSPVPPRQNNLNMTEGATEILAALAEEHDGIEPQNQVNDPENTTDIAGHEAGDSRRLGAEIRPKLDSIDRDNHASSDQNVYRKDLSTFNDNQSSLKKNKLKLKKKLDYHYQELDNTNISPAHFLLRRKSDNFKPSRNSPLSSKSESHTENDDSYLIENCDSPTSVNESRSNDSIWSQADESQYVSFVDATMYALNSGAAKVDNDNKRSSNKFDFNKQEPNVNSNSETNLQTSTSKFTKLKPLFRSSPNCTGLKNRQQKSPDQNDSQWSDVPDEQYLTLNLEDIENMENDFDTGNIRRTNELPEKCNWVNINSVDFEDSKPFTDNKPKFKNASVKNGLLSIDDLKDVEETLTSNLGGLNNLNVPLLKTTEKQMRVRDTPPLPNVPDTPPDQYSRKRRSVEKHDDMITSPTKQRTENKDLSLTPLKRSLADLHFK